MTGDENELFHRWADMSGIDPADRVAPSTEVAREGLIRQIVEGGQAQRLLNAERQRQLLDEARRRELADEVDDVIFVDYQADTRRRFKL